LGRSRFARIKTGVSGDLEHTRKHEAPPAPGESRHADVWNAMNRIRESRTMKGCRRLTQLLEFVIGATLRGESEHLKETTIGVAVFGRTPDYDPKVDTIVRSQAWRLRAKLRQYYAAEGADDPLIIDLPTGHYVPAFHAGRE
jgi:hypothetical protein